MCGIVGMVGQNGVRQSIYDALGMIQHRGQDAAGMITYGNGRVHLHRNNGLVREVIGKKQMTDLVGNLGMGHVRYPTAGSDCSFESQPFFVNAPYGLGIAHNGNLVNASELRTDLINRDLRHLNTQSDSEVLLNICAYELQQTGGNTLLPEQLFAALTNVYKRVHGAYSALLMINGYGLVAFRDPFGIRPLTYGVKETDGKKDYLFSSESVVLDALGYKSLGNVAPGEAIYVTMDGQLYRHQCVPCKKHSPCLFEYIYLARADSVIDGISVYRGRYAVGESLADELTRQYPDASIDVVMSIPDTSRTTALALAFKLGLPYSEGFVKNRYVGRTFIMPGEYARRNSVNYKLNAIRDEFRGKSILLVDDSIVRGTTSKEIVNLAREAGAKNVYFATAAPEVRYPNVYGIDIPIVEDLIAHKHSAKEVAKLIGADWLLYNNLDSVKKALLSKASSSSTVEDFEDSIFSNHYCEGNIDQAYLDRLAYLRKEAESKA